MSEKEKNYGSIYELPLQNASALAPEIEKRTIYGPENCWDDYVMRHFILPAHRGIPAHEHEWDHLMFTLSGDGVVEVEEEPGKRVPYLMRPDTGRAVPEAFSTNIRTTATCRLNFSASSPRAATRTPRNSRCVPNARSVRKRRNSLGRPPVFGG